jgi:Protein of unknown function (DUF680)
MNKIALTVAALLVATGTAFAGSDNYQGNQPAASVDTIHTGSVDNSAANVGKIQGSDRNLFGH